MIHKIQTKLLIAMLIVGIIATFPITIICTNALIKSSKEQAKDFGEKSAYYNSQIINTWLSEKAKTLTQLKTQIRLLENEEDIINLLRLYSDINQDFISAFIGTEDNIMIDAYGWIPDESYSVPDRPWYKKAIGKETYITTSVYKDLNKKENVTAIASSIDFLDKKGVLAVNIYVDYLVENINEIKYGNNGFAVLLDDNFNLITGPSKQNQMLVFKQISDLLDIKYDESARSEAFEIKIGDTEYIAAHSYIENFDWSLFLVAPLSDFTFVAYKIRDQMFYILVGTILLIVLLDLYLSRAISSPIESMINGISNIAKGNFDMPVNIKSKDEIGELSVELEKMRVNLKRIFESLKYESKIISMNSQNLIQHLDETYQGTSRFLLMLSHDIKTPITLIKGYSKALSMKWVDHDKTKDYGERILYRCEEIESIITDILDNTYQANNITVNLKEITILDYINMVQYNSENYINNQSRSFTVHINYKNIDVTKKVAVDIIKIQRVINNILSNAIKFTGVESHIQLVITARENRLLTFLKDFGVGIKKEEQAKIFNMFYKSDSTKKGYGLGLYINKAIIEAHNGEIFFKSQYGKGTSSGYYLNIL